MHLCFQYTVGLHTVYKGLFAKHPISLTRQTRCARIKWADLQPDIYFIFMGESNMKKTVRRLITAGAAWVFAAQMLPMMPAEAADVYLIRDKWDYCQSANYAESEHFVIFYGNNDTTGRVNDAFLQRNLADYEKLWHCYTEELGMKDLNVDMYGRSSQKYKTCVYLTYTGLDKYPDGWAFMSSEDGYGIEIISPDAMLDDLTIAHEFGHVVTMHQKAWVDQDITGAWWEPLANWFREMYLYSDWYEGSVQTAWFEPYIRNMSLTLPHGRNYYEVWPFMVYMCYNPDNLGTLGMDAVTRMISEAKPNEYPLDTVTRLFGVDSQTVFGSYAKRMATFDFGAKDAYQREFQNKLKESPWYWNLFYTVLEETAEGTLRVPQEEAPMQTGINIVPLNVTGDSITVSFRGLSDDPNAGWRACIVTVDANGRESYSELFGDGDTVTVSANGAAAAYLTVAGTPDTWNAVNAFDKERQSSYKNGSGRRRYPYEITLDGASVQQSGYTQSAGHAHSNGGGFVADSAKVADSVYVGPNAAVLGAANLSGNVRVEDYAVVANSVTAKDNVVISGHAVVDGGGWVYDNGWKSGVVTLSGNAVIGDSAVVTNSCTVSGNAKILQKAYLAEAVTVTDNAVVKGMSYCYGKGNYSGQVILDGDYANEETLSSGTAFGWLDTAGKDYTDGLIAGYDFAADTEVWAKDKHAATDALQSGAVWQAERTSANGVMAFDGDDDYLEIDDALLRTNALQISLAALWKGGTAQQDLFWFGDENAYMAFTPSNANGAAEFTMTDGTTVLKLTADAPLAKGEWSKITISLNDSTGKASLIINGTEAAAEAMTLTPNQVLSAAETDRAYLGKSLAHSNFKGAVDYFNLYFKDAEEPNITYSGKEDADNTDIAKLIGDVDLNGKVEIADAVCLQQYLLTAAEFQKENFEAADLDGNGNVTATDLTLLKRILLT